MTQFTSDFFTENRSRLKKSVGAECIVMTAHAQLQRTGDTTYPFRQESNFWYLTGIQDAAIWLLIDIEKDQEFLVLPNRAAHQDLWDGKLSSEALTNASGIRNILSHEEGQKKLKTLKASKNIIYTTVVENNYSEAHAFYLNPAKAELCQALQSYGFELEDIRPYIAKLRMIKQPLEQQAIQESIDITAAAFRCFAESRSHYKNETEVRRLFDASFAERGAQHAYQPIVASGLNAATIHYVKNSAPIEKNNFLLLDIGAEKDMYASDITRMFFVGEPSKEQETYYRLLQDTQNYAISLVKPGAYLKEIDQRVAVYMLESLKNALLVPLNTSEEELRKTLYPHALSHFLGLDTHDSGVYSEPLTEGMVITIEPGIYIPDKRMGLRIEDDILVTSTGYKNLSSAISKKLSNIL